VTALVLAHAEGVESDIMTTTLESFDRHFAVNARASWLLVREFARRFRGTPGRGRIVALTSDHVAGNLPTDTGWVTNEQLAEFARRNPQGRVGQPEDCASLVTFLCSIEGGWINGQLVRSDGGRP